MRNDTVELLPQCLRLWRPFGRVFGGRNTSPAEALGVIFFPKLFHAAEFTGGRMQVIYIPLTTSWRCAALINASHVDVRARHGHQVAIEITSTNCPGPNPEMYILHVCLPVVHSYVCLRVHKMLCQKMTFNGESCCKEFHKKQTENGNGRR